jgi:hypothetical protein
MLIDMTRRPTDTKGRPDYTVALEAREDLERVAKRFPHLVSG